MTMRFNVTIKGTGGPVSYTLREVATHLVERYSLTDAELERIVKLSPGQRVETSDLSIMRRTDR